MLFLEKDWGSCAAACAFGFQGSNEVKRRSLQGALPEGFDCSDGSREAGGGAGADTRLVRLVTLEPAPESKQPEAELHFDLLNKHQV